MPAHWILFMYPKSQACQLPAWLTSLELCTNVTPFGKSSLSTPATDPPARQHSFHPPTLTVSPHISKRASLCRILGDP